jgi:cytosine deaminase
VQALIELRDELKPYIDLQLVGFRQDGYLRDPDALKLMKRALDMSMDVVGGIPDYELMAPLGHEAVRQLCELADKRGLLVDMHIDQTTDPQSRQIEAIAQECMRLTMGARVSASHCPSMFNFDADKLIAQVAQADMNICVQPLVAATCWGIMSRVQQLLDAGVNVAFGQDCVMDPWYPFGKCEMLDVAHMAIVWGRVLTEKTKLRVFNGITYGGAKALNIDSYGIGKKIMPTSLCCRRQGMEAIRIRPARLAVIRRGEVIATQLAQCAELNLGGQHLTVDLALGDMLRGEGAYPAGSCALARSLK